MSIDYSLSRICPACNLKNLIRNWSTILYKVFGRDEATRTPDPYVPNVVRYQLRYIPIPALSSTFPKEKKLPLG